MNRLKSLHIGALAVVLAAIGSNAAAAPSSTKEAATPEAMYQPQCADQPVLQMLANTIRSANSLDNAIRMGFHDVKSVDGQSKSKAKAAKPALTCEASVTLVDEQTLMRTDALTVRYTLVPTAQPNTYALNFQPVRNRK